MSNKNSINSIKNVWNEKNNISLPSKFIKPEKVIHELAGFFSPGEFYYYLFNFQTLQLDYVSEGVKKLMNLSDIEYNSISLETMLNFYAPEDLALMQKKEEAVLNFLLNKIKPSLLTKYKATYLIRYKFKDGAIKKILHQAKTINVSEDGKIQQVIGVHADISHIPGPIDHKISFIGDGNLPSYYSLDPDELLLNTINIRKKFTNRELSILQLMASGFTSSEIAEKMFISEFTVNTHRKNILGKSDAKNVNELIANCVRNGLI
ncbi:helix-turn-helix transcriptional regulator [uncultured Polaribacter sp.]|uniref:response regulator transcription factor n=1 Tax=uncultured Polaribacter sp. TaxID=174711 RepID=UPI002634875F|nr:helix-turn-helix transcriptional regulator [uncultured Polaribacter sp.]